MEAIVLCQKAATEEFSGLYKTAVLGVRGHSAGWLRHSSPPANGNREPTSVIPTFL